MVLPFAERIREDIPPLTKGGQGGLGTVNVRQLKVVGKK